jgi:hypothetical protein
LNGAADSAFADHGGRGNPSHEQMVFYSLTEASILRVPLLAPAPQALAFSRLESAYEAAIAKPPV